MNLFNFVTFVNILNENWRKDDSYLCGPVQQLSSALSYTHAKTYSYKRKELKVLPFEPENKFCNRYESVGSMSYRTVTMMYLPVYKWNIHQSINKGPGTIDNRSVSVQWPSVPTEMKQGTVWCQEVLRPPPVVITIQFSVCSQRNNSIAVFQRGGSQNKSIHIITGHTL